MTFGRERPDRYRGRFAPSPTGPLHFGSLVAATASYLEARTQDGVWLVRIEDLDPPRVVPGAADEILRALESFGFQWDEAVIWQSEREDAYREALEALQDREAVYPCGCSRREIAEAGTFSDDGAPRYPGTCRDGIPDGKEPRAWRIRVDDRPIRFKDRCQGSLEFQLAKLSGDFTLKRADGVFSYQLAVVVDDAYQGVTDVVRGADLLLSTPRQIWVQNALGLATPDYFHTPVAERRPGEKLSKQTRAPALDPSRATEQLFDALGFLGQHPAPALRRGTIDELWEWSIVHWNAEIVPRLPARVAPQA